MSDDILQVSGLTVAYGDEPVVRDVDLTVRRGEVIALVGASGSGKSTLALAILGLLPAGGRIVGGSVGVAGRRIDLLSDRELGRIRGARVALVPQDPGVGLNPVVPVGRQVAEALRVHGVDADQARHRAVDILRRAGLDRPQDRARQLPGALSGGQRQRVLIGIALACDPDLVIADEPTSALDVTVARRVLDHFDERVAGSGAAVLLVTHDLAVAAERSSRIVVMRDGRIVETGATSAVLDAPDHEYTAALIAASHPRRVAAARRGLDTGVRPDATAAVHVADVRRRFGSRSASTVALDGVTVRVRAGTTLAVVGESGSGKTTLARIVAGLDTPDSGTVRLGDVEIDARAARRRRRLWRRVQLVHQNPYSSLDPRLRVGAIVAEPLRVHRLVSRRERPERVRRLLAEVGLGAEFVRRRPHDLSGGQRQRVAMARALACEPDVLVLDEPTSALDVLVRQQVLDLISDLQRTQNISVVLVSHDLGVVGAVADDVVVLRSGRVVESGPVGDVFAAPSHEYTRSLLSAVPGAPAPSDGAVAK